MGGYTSKDSQVVKAENYHQQSLDDLSFSVFNIHSASGLGGALLVIVILLLAASGYCLARCKD